MNQDQSDISGDHNARSPNLSRQLWIAAAGLMAGILGGAGLSLISLVIRLVVGSEAFDSEIGSFGGLMGAYLLGGAAGGLLAGLLYRLGTSLAGALVVGAIAAAPYTLIFGVRVFGPIPTWSLDELIVGAAWAVAVGGYVGYRIRKAVLEDPESFRL